MLSAVLVAAAAAAAADNCWYVYTACRYVSDVNSHLSCSVSRVRMLGWVLLSPPRLLSFVGLRHYQSQYLHVTLTCITYQLTLTHSNIIIIREASVSIKIVLVTAQR